MVQAGDAADRPAQSHRAISVGIPTPVAATITPTSTNIVVNAKAMSSRRADQHHGRRRLQHRHPQLQSFAGALSVSNTSLGNSGTVTLEVPTITIHGSILTNVINIGTSHYNAGDALAGRDCIEEYQLELAYGGNKHHHRLDRHHQCVASAAIRPLRRRWPAISVSPGHQSRAMSWVSSPPPPTSRWRAS